ncbi:tyrosine-type recombinase/integrase [Sediminibacillus albus]|nr:site-specific integrase [Sediminibacillus albus]
MKEIFYKLKSFQGGSYSTLSSIHIQSFIDELRKNCLSDSTIKRIFNVVHASLNHAVQIEVIKKNPTNHIEKPKVSFKENVIWNLNEVSLFLKTSQNSPYYIVFLLALTTGMRQGEILGLRWKDIDFENECLYVRKTLTHDGKGFKDGLKSKAGYRSIGLDTHTLNALESKRNKNKVKKLENGSLYVDCDLVICTTKGAPINPRNLLRAFHNIISKTSLTKIRFHDLRHTHASLMQQGENIKLISERLGHEASNRLAKQFFKQ